MTSGQLATIFAAFSILAIIVILELAARKDEAKATQKALELQAIKESLIDIDSLEDVIAKRVLDSLRVRINYQGREIHKLKQQIANESRKNEELRKKYNSLSVSLPDL